MSEEKESKDVKKKTGFDLDAVKKTHAKSSFFGSAPQPKGFRAANAQGKSTQKNHRIKHG